MQLFYTFIMKEKTLFPTLVMLISKLVPSVGEGSHTLTIHVSLNKLCAHTSSQIDNYHNLISNKFRDGHISNPTLPQKQTYHIPLSMPINTRIRQYNLLIDNISMLHGLWSLHILFWQYAVVFDKGNDSWFWSGSPRRIRCLGIYRTLLIFNYWSGISELLVFPHCIMPLVLKRVQLHNKISNTSLYSWLIAVQVHRAYVLVILFVQHHACGLAYNFWWSWLIATWFPCFIWERSKQINLHNHFSNVNLHYSWTN